MTTFDRREEAFENLFAHDEEMHFKAESRRAKLIAAWAAARMGKSGGDLETYVASVLSFTVQNGGEAALVDRIAGDLDKVGVPMSAVELHQQMDAFLAEATHYVRTA